MINKMLRVLFVLFFLAGLIALDMHGAAWAAKLKAGSPLLDKIASDVGLAGRPPGTTLTTDTIIPVTGGQTVTVGSCATVTIGSGPNGVSYTASVVQGNDLAQALPGSLKSCGIKIDATPSKALGAQVQVCFAVLPADTVFGYYWNGTQWVKDTLEVSNGQSCLQIPADSSNQTFAALFDK